MIDSIDWSTGAWSRRGIPRKCWRATSAPSEVVGIPQLDGHRWFELDRPHRWRARTPAIFLDRDGVIIVEKHYIKAPDEVELYPGVAEWIASMCRREIPIVVVTNQSGIGRGLFGWTEYLAVHRRMLDLLDIDRPFAAVYANSYRPDEGGDAEAPWRKPSPGMLLQAASDLDLHLESSVMVGDKLVDLQAGDRAGIIRLIHIRSGHGAGERPKIAANFPGAELADSLAHIPMIRFRAP